MYYLEVHGSAISSAATFEKALELAMQLVDNGQYEWLDITRDGSRLTTIRRS